MNEWMVMKLPAPFPNTPNHKVHRWVLLGHDVDGHGDA